MFAPAPGGEGVFVEKLVETEEGIDGLGFVGGVDGDDADREFGI